MEGRVTGWGHGADDYSVTSRLTLVAATRRSEGPRGQDTTNRRPQQHTPPNTAADSRRFPAFSSPGARPARGDARARPALLATIGRRVRDPAQSSNRREGGGTSARRSLDADWSVRTRGRCHTVQTSRLLPLLSSRAFSPQRFWVLIDLGWSLREGRKQNWSPSPGKGSSGIREGCGGRRPTLKGQRYFFFPVQSGDATLIQPVPTTLG